MLRKTALLFFVFYLKLKQLILPKRVSKQILIIKPDAIGDYVIFRNFLSIIINDEKFKNCKITLLGNIIWEELAYKLDGEILENVISINHKTLNKNWISLISEVCKNNYQAVITYNYSRTPITDFFAFVASSKTKIAIDGDNIRIGRISKKIFNLLVYDKLITIPPTLKTEFSFLKFFTESIVEHKINIHKPFIQLTDIHLYDNLFDDKKYVFIAPGAGVMSRQPEIELLVNFTRFALEKYSVCFVGSDDDNIKIDAVISRLNLLNGEKILNLAGKIPVRDLPDILNKASIIVCNDSVIYHLAIALNKPVLCIAGGGHFERFVNYVNQDNVQICYESMPCYNCNWYCIYKFPENSPYPCISAITFGLMEDKFMLLEKTIEAAV
jgi:ADP-heptose:LPS heptosyltransferase